MENTDLLNLWKSYDQKLEAALLLNRKNTGDITKMKVRHFMVSMRPLKLFTIVVGMLWVVLIDILLINVYGFASPFFLISAGAQVLLTKLAIGIYLYQSVLIERIDINMPVFSTQVQLARLKSSTLWVARVLFLQLPFWTTFYWTESMFQNGNLLLIIVQVTISLAFTAAAIWLFININAGNKDKKWFRLIFSGKEWDPVMKSIDLLDQLEE